jgi:alpha-D-xyloside xylohydrolase
LWSRAGGHGATRIRIEAWGEDSPRVRVGRHRVLDDLPGALVPPKPTAAEATADGRVVNGALTVIVVVE